MIGFLPRLAAAIEHHRLLPRRRKILVAVSGGADSMALLHALRMLAPRFGWQLSVAHFNHQLRGRASRADEQLVRRTAAKSGLPCSTGRGPVARFARQSGLSTEMAARRLRHEFLARVARQQRIPIIALAHHADDQVELFFLRLLRGAGGAGAAGMKPQSPSPADGTIQLVRPLLEFTKAELLAFTREQGIRFRDDASNASPDFLRNRIRHELLPLLRKHYQSGLDRTVLRQMDIIGSESQLVDAIAGDWLLETAGAKPPNFDLLPVALQRRILHRQLLELGAPADFELVEQLRVSPGQGASLGPDLVVNRDAAGRVELRRTVSPRFNPAETGGNLATRAGHLEFGGRNFAWQIRPQKRFRRPSGPPGREVFDAARVGSHFHLRHWRPGDRFQPLGMKTAVKLQDLFVNARVLRDQRHVRVVATTPAGDIFWVEGLRPGEPFKVTPATLRQLVWHWSVLPV